ncbi:MAG: STAS domain-containing protein [Cyclobacteriaceae bacterium]
MIQIDQNIENDIYKLEVGGEVDASSSIYLDNAITEALKSNHKKILVDCSQLNYISSAGLGVFMSYIEELNNRGILMVIYGLNDKVRNVFQILGLDQLLRIVSSEEEAKSVVDAV